MYRRGIASKGEGQCVIEGEGEGEGSADINLHNKKYSTPEKKRIEGESLTSAQRRGSLRGACERLPG